MLMRSIPPSRGVTLIELVIAMVVSTIVLLGAILASNAQQRSFYDSQRSRNALENARAALLYLEQRLPLAGLGMDPSLAIDFQFYNPSTLPLAAPLCPGVMNPCNRDKTTDADELIFYSRNQNYWIPRSPSYNGPYQGRLWQLTGVSSTTVELTARAGDVFPMGQILQFVCPSTLNYAYFTVSINATAASAGPITLNLQSDDPANPFRRQTIAQSFYTAGCAAPRVFQIDRYRLHIRPMAQPDGRFIPYLMLDRGIDWTGSSSGGPDGVIDDKDEIIVAEGIEAFQVAYTLANPALGRAGATAGTPIVFSAANADQTISITPGPNLIARTTFPGTALLPPGWTVYTPSSFFRYTYTDAIRQTIHQANIRAVEIALVARSPEPDPTTPSNIPVGSSFTLLNQSGAPIWITSAPAVASGSDGYHRAIVNTVIDLPNMTVRSLPGF